MHRTLPLILVCLCAPLLRGESGGDAEAFGAWLEDGARALAEDRVTPAQASDWLAQAAKRSPEERALVQVLVGAWQRQVLGRPDWTLVWLAPAKGQPASRTAPALGADGRPRPWSALPVADPDTWPVEPSRALVTAELCRCLAADGDLAAAITTVGAWHALGERDPFVQAVMAGALVPGMLADARTDQAVELADRAWAALQAQLGEDYGRTPARRLAIALLAPWRDEARHRQELERYGPAWSAYRDADVARLVQNDPFLAMVRYGRVERDFPATVYATAARANRLVVELAAARSDQADERLAWIARQKARIDAIAAAIAEAERAGLGAAASQARLKALLAQQQEVQAALALWPVAPRKLADHALAEDQAFLAADPDGLYRCDALLARADWTWEEDGDAAAAAKLYDQALEWLARVPTRDQAIDGLDFDGRIRQVAAPPPEPVSRDMWGNVRWSTVAPGMLLNHRTCPWLVGQLTMRAAARRGLCAFALGDSLGAQRAVDLLARYDPFERLRQEGRAYVSNAARLRDGFASGRLFATQEELALFQGRERPLLLSAELAFECEEWEDAQRAYAAVLARFGERLKPEQRAYVLYQTANCQLYRRGGDRVRALAILRTLSKDAERTPTWPRIQLSLWDLLRWEPATEAEGLAALDRLLATRVGQDVKDDALFRKAFHFFQSQDPQRAAQGRAWLQSLTASKVEWVSAGASNWLAHPEALHE